MGDADGGAEAMDQIMQPEEIDAALEELGNSILHLEMSMDDLEERMMPQLLRRMKSYLLLRSFVIVMNFVFIPVVMALGLSYILLVLIDIGPQDPFHSVIKVLWLMSAFLGFPLYIGSMWGVKNLPLPEELTDEELSSAVIDEEFNIIDFILMRPVLDAGYVDEIDMDEDEDEMYRDDYEEEENYDQDDVNAADEMNHDDHEDEENYDQDDGNAADDEEAADPMNNQDDSNAEDDERDSSDDHIRNNPEDVQDGMDQQRETPRDSEPATTNSTGLAEEQVNNMADSNDNTSRTSSSGVDRGPTVEEASRTN